mmetsp:Transcript_11803/g.19936  ORF Transcript_11803/g.19936 Transcript_11803/m.19936 type:complete len:175 (-) Transcript_11803:578-1102(-)
MINFVCVECGALSKIIRELQNENYCLERCKRCGEIADKYVEYDNNLKILSVLLCFTQIHRHIFFNVDKIKNIKLKCYGLTIFLLFLFYIHESKVNYRKFLEEQFISEVREMTLKEFRNGLHASSPSPWRFDNATALYHHRSSNQTFSHFDHCEPPHLESLSTEDQFICSQLKSA